MYAVGSPVRLKVVSYDPNHSHDATTYAVRDVGGDLVAEGAIPGDGVLVLDGLSASPGWFKVYLSRSTPAPAPWGLCAGEGSFGVAPNLQIPAETHDPAGDRVGEGFDIALRAAVDLQAPRCPLRLPTLARDVDAALVAWGQVDRLYTAPPPIRWAALPENNNYRDAAVRDQLRPELQRLVAAGIDHFEFWNEPFGGAHAAPYEVVEPEFVAFADFIRSLGGKVMGATTVSIQEKGPWERLVTEHADLIDVFTFHNYDGYSPGVTGNIVRGKVSFAALQRVLERSGNAGKPLYNTEAPAHFAATYGSFEPMRQAAWSTLEMHMSARAGIPLRHMCRFKDRQTYFGYPSGYSAASPYPALLMMKTLWDHIGDSPLTPVPVGPVADNHVLASLAQRQGTSVLWLQTDGWQGKWKFKVPPGARVVDPYGGITPAEVDGVYVDQLPRLVLFDPAHTVKFTAPFPSFDAGQDQKPVVTVSSHKPKVDRPDATYLNRPASDGSWTLQPLPARAGDPLKAWHSADGTGAGEWIQYDFAAPTRLDSILISTPYPWQSVSTNLGFRVEVDGAVTWEEALPAPVSISWTSTARTEATFTETYWLPQTMWYLRLPQALVANTIRIVFSGATYGGVPTFEAGSSAGHGEPLSSGQGDSQHVSVRQVRFGLSTESDGGTARVGEPYLVG